MFIGISSHGEELAHIIVTEIEFNSDNSGDAVGKEPVFFVSHVFL